MSLHEKIVLITGAGSQVGKRLTEVFSEAGARLALCVRRVRDLMQAPQNVLDAPASPMVVTCDLRFEEDVVRMVHRVVQRFERIDVVVNCSPLVGPRAAIVDYPIDPWRNVIATNLTGTYLVCREVLPWMTRQGTGSIINVTSSLSRSTHPQWGAYLVSNHGVEGLTQLLASEVKDSGVRVNTVDIGMPSTRRRVKTRQADWTQAFLWLAGDDSAGANGRRIRAATFSKVH